LKAPGKFSKLPSLRDFGATQHVKHAAIPTYKCPISYSVTALVRASSIGGTVRPSALAVFRLIANFKREAGINDRSRQMPNETHLKRLISDAVFEAHNTHGRQAAGDRLFISREDSRIIAGAVFDALRRANVLLIDQPGEPNPETAA
jgi:hypothetical protein